jgi:hypothetical protein
VKLGLGLHPLDLIKTAKELLNSGRGKVRQSNLRRAQSSVYYARLAMSEIETDIGAVESAIADLMSAPIRHRRAFAVWVLLKNRK